jgi:hypothetical protein
LPAALPHLRPECRDADAEINMMIKDELDGLQILPEMIPLKRTAPPLIDAAVDVRKMLANDPTARAGYERLYQLVGQHNPDSRVNTEKALRYYTSKLTQSVIRFLASAEQDGLTARHEYARTDPNAALDLPPDLEEPTHWDVLDVQHLKRDLRLISLPYQRDPLDPRGGPIHHDDIPSAPTITDEPGIS